MTYYDEIAEGYNSLYGEEQKEKARVAIDKIKNNSYKNLLDVGCGTGIATEEFIKHFKCKATGIDPAEKLLKQCSFETICTGAENLPFPDKSFDLVVSLTAIQNFENIAKGISEIKRVASDTIVITTLKRSDKINEIRKGLGKQLIIQQENEAQKDIIWVLKNI